MITRTFEYSEGTSNKFWTITLDGRCHTVNYGRLGTAGQSQTAEFGSDSEAEKSYNKLVAEKLKKGYLEKTGNGAGVVDPARAVREANSTTPSGTSAATHAQGTPAPAAAAKEATSEAAPQAKTVESAPAVDAPARKTEPVREAKVRRQLDLHLSAYSYVPGKRAAPSPLPPAVPFDLDDCLARARTKIRVRTYGWDWDFSRAVPERQLSPQEAEFWLTAMTLERGRDSTPEKIADTLAKRTYKGQLDNSLPLATRYLSPLATLCLATLLSPDQLRELLLNPKTTQGAERWANSAGALRQGFRSFVLPYLDEAAIEKWRVAARVAWDPNGWPTDFYQAPAPAYFYGAMLGLHDEVRALIGQWPDNLYIDPSWDHTHYHRPQDVVLGAGPADQVAHQFRRLKLPVNTPDDIITLLAITDVSALDIVARTIASIGKKEDAEALFDNFALVHAPEAAPFALELMLTSKTPKAARQWLDDNLDEAIVGLMPVAAASTGKLAEAATEYLNGVKRRGNADRIAAHLDAVDSEVASRIRAKVLDVVEVQLPELSQAATPAWWKNAIEQAPLKKSKPHPWAADLPAIAVGEHSLGADHITVLLGALQASTLEAPHPLLGPLREHAAPDRLDAFGWKLFERWMAEGAPSKERWAFLATGFLGGDRSVLKLAPLVREWPGESQHQRAVLGLDVLRTIGTDTALMQINGIAQKVKFKGLKERAIQSMDAIAASRNMSRAQLEDRIVPDCGLDERGERQFDFGARQFRFVLGPELKPMIRFADGTLKTDLPKPNSKDDAAKADPAVADWKLLKKQIADVAKIQAVRLEQAMVTGRRWSGEEFEKLLVHHPLMVHLVRMLVWASYDASGAVTATFRVTEDQTLADSSDEPIALAPNARIGVLHPLQVTAEPQVLEQWGQLFGDYEIVPPFPQLGRPSYRLTPEQLAKKEITHFEARGKLAAQTLVFGLEKLGWARGIPQDAGWVGEHSKQFFGANVTAVITYEEGFSVGYWEGAGEQTIKSVFFLPGLYTPQMYPQHKDSLRLADVHAIALSEVLGDCELLLTKAK